MSSVMEGWTQHCHASLQVDGERDAETGRPSVRAEATPQLDGPKVWSLDGPGLRVWLKPGRRGGAR